MRAPLGRKRQQGNLVGSGGGERGEGARDLGRPCVGWCGVALSAGGRNCDDGDGDAMMRDEVGGGGA